MCGAGIEDHYLQILEQEQQDKDIEQLLFVDKSFVKISFSTLSISVPAKN